MASEHYSEFIEEAFIKPIRSVLIVDDDYPTFSEILESKIAQNAGNENVTAKNWSTSPERVKGLIDRFRTPGHPLLVDIHDGANVGSGEEIAVAAHLHQSDLLVLDYQLEKSKPGDGTRAIEIIRSVASNDHFNLVVIHTSEDLDKVFYPVLTALVSISDTGFSDGKKNAAKALIETREDEDDEITARLDESVSIEQYFHSRLYPTRFKRVVNDGHQPYTAFKEVCREAGWTDSQTSLVLDYQFNEVEKSLIGKSNPNPSGELNWSTGSIKWIRSDSVFIAFSNKTNEDNLLEELQKALNDWNPQPSRLFLTKLRAEIDEYGVVAQSQALTNTHALAHWYKRLLEANGSQRRWQIAESVSRHSDQLLTAILPRVEDYASRLIQADGGSGTPDEICKKHFKVDLQKTKTKLVAEREHNAFVCSQKPDGWHLSIGHIFQMNKEYWVCLTPACDMVPAQMSKTLIKTYGERLPFVGLKLQLVSEQTEIEDIQSNRFIFFRVGDSVKRFSYNNPLRPNSKPLLHMLYAESRGIFVAGTFKLKIARTQSGATRLVSKKYDATVVKQLRYEYALNLIQKLGVSMTRIGLDFEG